MDNLSPTPQKINSSVPFRTWEGQVVVAVKSGGWRRLRPVDLALLPRPRRQLVLLRDMEE